LSTNNTHTHHNPQKNHGRFCSLFLVSDEAIY